MIIDGFQTFQTSEEYIDFEQMHFMDSIRDDGAEWFDGSEESVVKEFKTYLTADDIDTAEFKATLSEAMPEIVKAALTEIENFKE